MVADRGKIKKVANLSLAEVSSWRMKMYPKLMLKNSKAMPTVTHSQCYLFR